MLLSMLDWRVHAVYDACDPFPIPVCGGVKVIAAGIWLPRAAGEVRLCFPCMVAVPDPENSVELRPSGEIRQRHLAMLPGDRRWSVLELVRRRAARCYDRRIQDAIDAVNDAVEAERGRRG